MTLMESAPAETGRPQKYVGSRVKRVEDRRMLLGQSKYLPDLEVPGMVHAAFLRSPHAHAKILSIDTTEAQNLEGVVAIFTGADIAAHTKPLVSVLQRPESVACTKPLLAVDKVRHVGEALAVVIADSRYIAEDAIDLIQVEWEVLPAVTDAEAAIADGAPQLHDDIPNNNIGHIEYTHGDVEKAFAEADHVFSKRLHTHRHMAAPMETRGVLASYDAASGDMTMYSSTQMPHFIRTLLVPVTGLKESQFRVISPEVGGGFGQKCHVFVEEAVIPVASKLIGRPVKWVEDRYENLAASAHAKDVIGELEIAVTKEGKMTAMRARYIGDGGAYSIYPWTSLIDVLPAANTTTGIYDVQNLSYVVDGALTNKCQTGAYRGVGWTPGHTLREVLIDEIAAELGLDPVEFRLMNVIPSEPYVSASGMKYDGGSYRESLELSAKMLDYEGFRTRQKEARAQGRFIGIGFSPFVEPTAWGSHVAKANGFPAEFYDSASIHIEPDGSVVVTNGLQNHGQGHETSLAQVAADHLGVRLEDVRVIEGDTGRAVYGMGTYASRSAVIGGGSIMRAAADVKKKMIQMAAHALEVSPEDIDLYNGVATVKGVPNKSMTVAQIAGMAHFGGAARPAGIEPALTATRSYDPPETYTNGVTAVIVEVDPETGLVEILRCVAVEDCGTVLNPLILDGQVCGALAQGFGGALYEDLIYNEEGQFLSGSLVDFLFPAATEMPAVEIAHIETPSTVTEGGIKGAGEAGTISGAAAIGNAVVDALREFNVKVDQMPIPPNTIREMIRKAQAARD
ncbi:xanthine dehydrogenase family protein molybdopterin-binding subunit [Pseudonocardia bannensis]|nr:xanthine dehydrogenase family protein molybdopterin-binding subunit [Pseudonocardia bannensis]